MDQNNRYAKEGNWLDNLNILLDSAFIGFAQMRYDNGLIVEHANETLQAILDCAEKTLGTTIDAHLRK